MNKRERQKAERDKIHSEMRRNLLTIEALAEEIIELADSAEIQSKHMIRRVLVAKSILRTLHVSALP